jgi:hypothetical protein
LLSFAIVTATIDDVTTAAMQPTYLLAAICREDWVDVLSNVTLYDLPTPSSNAVFVIGGGA